MTVIISSLIGPIVVALLNHYLTIRREQSSTKKRGQHHGHRPPDVVTHVLPTHVYISLGCLFFIWLVSVYVGVASENAALTFILSTVFALLAYGLIQRSRLAYIGSILISLIQILPGVVLVYPPFYKRAFWYAPKLTLIGSFSAILGLGLLISLLISKSRAYFRPSIAQATPNNGMQRTRK